MIIAPGTRFEGPRRVPLASIVDPSTRRISPRWLTQYWRDLTTPGRERHDLGVLLLSPRPDDPGRYTIEDGRHRYYASLFAGRRDVLALILLTEPGQPGYATAPENDTGSEEMVA